MRDAFDVDGYKRIGDIGVTHTMTMPWYIYGGGDSIEGKCDAIKRFGDDVIARFDEPQAAQSKKESIQMTTFSRARGSSESSSDDSSFKKRTNLEALGAPSRRTRSMSSIHQGPPLAARRSSKWLVPVMARCKGWVYPIEWIAIDGNWRSTDG